MHNEQSVEIDRPIAEVFDRTNHNVVDWSIIVVEDEVIEEQPGHVGTRFRIVTEERGKKMEFEGEVVGWKEPTRSSIVMRGQHFDIDCTYDFEALDDNRTRVTQNSKVDAKGFFKVMFFLMGWMMRKSSCKAQDDELQSLKRFCESQAPTPSSEARADSA